MHSVHIDLIGGETMTEMNDSLALDAFLGGATLKAVRDEYGYRNVTTCMAAIERALKRALEGQDPERARRIEIARIDAMERAIYPSAVEGDLKCINQCVSLGERRLRLLDSPGSKGNGLTKSYESTVLQLRNKRAISAEDEAAIQSGRLIAEQIDYAIRNCTGQEVTKALYLMPHLMNILNTLGATPESRKKMAAMVDSGKEEIDAEDPLTAFTTKSFGRS